MFKELSERYSVIKSEIAKLLLMIENIDKYRKSTEEKVYAKVKEEYSRKLERFIQELSLQRVKFENLLKELEEKRIKVTQHIAKCNENMEEIKFRQIISEGDQEDLEKFRISLYKEIDENQSYLERCINDIEKISEILSEEIIPEKIASSIKTDSTLTSDLTSDNISEEEQISTVALSEEELLMELEKKRISYSANPSLMISKGPESGKRFFLTQSKITIGRERTNNIQINDSEMSRYHAEIIYENGHYFLVDYGSSNGSFINGKQVKKSILRDNDEIKMGNTYLVVKLPKEGELVNDYQMPQL